MRIEGFPRDEQAHDFARAFKNHVDATIAQIALDRDAFLAAAFE